MNELLAGKQFFDQTKVASILRDTRGVGGKKIGYGNEMAINQLIAHHSVIFNPREQKFWVSTHPYQLGELVAYDANRIFAMPEEMSRMPSIAGSIPADSLLFSDDYAGFMRYRQMCDTIKASIRGKVDWKIDPSFIERFERSNPEMYTVYRFLGDWYESQKEYPTAVRFWETALTKDIPRLSEKVYLEEQINRYKNR